VLLIAVVQMAAVAVFAVVVVRLAEGGCGFCGCVGGGS
jgi:hypothetical protein